MGWGEKPERWGRWGGRGREVLFSVFSLASNQQKKMDPFCFNSKCRQTEERERVGVGGGGGGAGRQTETKTDSDREKRGGVGLGRVGHEKKIRRKKIKKSGVAFPSQRGQTRLYR